MYSILNESPEPVTALRPDAPRGLERIIDRCLAKQADQRYQGIDDAGYPLDSGDPNIL